MGLLDLASNNSFWRGYDYYTEGKVLSKSRISDRDCEGTVAGSNGEVYHVTIDLAHPKRSVCDCAHAEGTRRICKHKVALYFSFFPDEAEKAIREAEEYEQEEEQRAEEQYKELEAYVNSLSKQQLREELLWRLVNEAERKRYW